MDTFLVFVIFGFAAWAIWRYETKRKRRGRRRSRRYRRQIRIFSQPPPPPRLSRTIYTIPYISRSDFPNLRDHGTDEVYFIADTHFGNSGQVAYDRGCSSVSQNNAILARGWNETVEDGDTVYILGDFADKSSQYWWGQMNGKKYLIRGNHDNNRFAKSCHTHASIQLGGVPVMLVHDPADVPDSWNGWVIHGHYHDAPFVDRYNKRICVSADVIGRRPIGASRVLAEILRAEGLS